MSWFPSCRASFLAREKKSGSSLLGAYKFTRVILQFSTVKSIISMFPDIYNHEFVYWQLQLQLHSLANLITNMLHIHCLAKTNENMFPEEKKKHFRYVSLQKQLQICFLTNMFCGKYNQNIFPGKYNYEYIPWQI